MKDLQWAPAGERGQEEVVGACVERMLASDAAIPRRKEYAGPASSQPRVGHAQVPATVHEMTAHGLQPT